ncbi:MAG: flagellin, partial [Sedimentisphaerales bacterium]|nr:flagellin [Sedimentisphaerales bacterium]
MTIKVNTNIYSLIAQNNVARVDNSLLKSLERLSTGLRINCACDDPAGLIAVENFNAQIAGTQQSIENGQRA